MGAGCAKELVKVKILSDTNKYFQVGASMSNEERVQVLLFLIQNMDVFAWNPYEVLGVDPGFIVHKLNIDPSYPPKKQKPRRSANDHVEAVRQEVEKLKEARPIKETFFPKWLVNTMVVRKKNGKWKVCVDFTDLNRACPKDPFPMPKIDQLVDATYGHPRMNFLDANYHYTMMPFGQKNARATYQRMMTRMFRDKIGHTVEVYIDDMVVKRKQEARHVEDLQGVFEVLQKHRLRLKAEKCTIGVRAGKFLGYLITNRGIEVNPNQIEVVKHLRLPSNSKEVQVLIGMLAALNQFISKFSDHCRPFYQLLKKWKGFRWDDECEKGFPRTQGVLSTGADVKCTRARRGTVHVLLGIRTCCKCCAFKGPRSTTAHVLY